MLLTRPPYARAAGALVASVLLLLGLAGCGASGDDAVSAVAVAGSGDEPDGSDLPVTPATLRPGDPVPRPSGRVVLVVRGGTTTNVGEELRLDLAQLDSLGTVEYSVEDDLATGVRATFSGPLVRTVLELAGADGGTTLHTAALNDYLVDVPVTDATELPLMLATRMNGKRMSVANYGPTRFVYPTEGYGLDPVTYDPRWIWQLRSIEVE